MPAGQHKLVVTYLGNSQTTPLALNYLIVQNGTITNSTTAGGSNAGGTINKSNKSNNIGPIVGGIVGGVLLIACVRDICLPLYPPARQAIAIERETGIQTQ